MITIESLVEQGANVKLEVTPSDLKMFAESIVQRTMAARQEELDAEMQRAAEETWRSAATSSPSRWATKTCMPNPMSAAYRREGNPKV